MGSNSSKVRAGMRATKRIKGKSRTRTLTVVAAEIAAALTVAAIMVFTAAAGTGAVAAVLVMATAVAAAATAAVAGMTAVAAAGVTAAAAVARRGRRCMTQDPKDTSRVLTSCIMQSGTPPTYAYRKKMSRVSTKQILVHFASDAACSVIS